MKNNSALKWYWSLVLLIFGGLLAGLYITGDISTYLHPKLQGLMVVSIAVLFILCILSVSNALKGYEGVKVGWGHVAFTMFFVIFFLAPNANASVTVAAENGIKFYENNQAGKSIELQVEDLLKTDEKEQSDTLKIARTDADSTVQDQNKLESVESLGNSQVQAEVEMEVATQDTLLITEENYVQIIDDLHIDMEANVGKTVTFSGLIYREDHFDSTNMVIGRLLMYCCAADAQIVGLLCENEHASEFEDEAWVEVTGELGIKDYSDPNMDIQARIPYVHVSSIKRIKAPEDPYVYADY